MGEHGSGRVAAIDLGTNTFLMLIAARAADGRLQVLDDLCRTPRIGAGLARTGRLAPEALERGLEVLAEFRERLDRERIPDAGIRAVGTAALRRARNAAEFVEGARRRSGITVEVISEDEEARLGYRAVVPDGAAGEVWILDPGGGSTELVAGGGTIRRSAPIGAVVLTERWLGPEGTSELRGASYDDDTWRALLGDAALAFAGWPARAELPAPDEVVCLGGTGANLVCLEQGLARFDTALFDTSSSERWILRSDRVSHWAEILRRRDAAGRQEFPIERERAGILPAGLACLAAALRRLEIDATRVSVRGLRYEIARELAARSV